MSATQGMPLFMEVGRVIAPAPITDLDGTAIDVSGAVEKSVQVTRVTSGESTEWSADFDTDGTDGQLVHVTESGELDEVGRWRVWAFVRLSDGRELYSPERTIQVHETSDGGTGVGSGTTTHAPRHQEGGADPLLVETLPSNGTSGEVPIADGAGGLDMGAVTAGMVDSGAAAQRDPLLADGAGNAVFFDWTRFADTILLRGPRKLKQASESTYTLTDDDHWAWLKYASTGQATWSVPDTLPSGFIAIIEVTSSGTLTVAGAGTLQITGHTGTLRAGDMALLLVQGSTAARLVRIGSTRLMNGPQAGGGVGAISTDYTLTRLDHGHLIVVDTSGGDVTVTVPDTLPEMHETYFDVQGSGNLLFASSGTMTLVGPGTTCAPDGTCGVLVVDSTRAKLVGELS